jgi:hypothetical protein
MKEFFQKDGLYLQRKKFKEISRKIDIKSNLVENK